MKNLLNLSSIVLIPRGTNGGNWLKKKMNFLVSDEKEKFLDPYSLPIFTSPMEAIVGKDNWKTWQDSGIKPIIPRTESLLDRIEACCFIYSAFSIEEIKDEFLNKDRRTRFQGQYHICIDSGNGHDRSLFQLCSDLKAKYSNQIILMVGNISNPETYLEYNNIGIDYVRVGMYSGSLVNKSKFGFDYPMASLLMDINEIRRQRNLFRSENTKVIADGGILSHSDILKAIAIGADYVMIGRGLSGILESSGTIYRKSKNEDGVDIIEEIENPENLSTLSSLELESLDLIRQYSGNTSLEIQALRSGFTDVSDWRKVSKVKISDSSWIWVPVNTKISDWLIELKECLEYGFMMSDSTTWEEFRKNILYGEI